MFLSTTKGRGTPAKLRYPGPMSSLRKPLRFQPGLRDGRAAPEAGGTAGDPLPRPPAYVRHAPTNSQREPEDRLRDARALDHSHHPRHLFPRAAEHARSGSSRYGRGPIVAYCCQIPRTRLPGAFCRPWEKCCFAGLSLSRGGGTRTHTPFQDPDFKSGASADSATPPRIRSGV
jgi:hypothetical protein